MPLDNPPFLNISTTRGAPPGAKAHLVGDHHHRHAIGGPGPSSPPALPRPFRVKALVAHRTAGCVGSMQRSGAIATPLLLGPPESWPGYLAGLGSADAERAPAGCGGLPLHFRAASFAHQHRRRQRFCSTVRWGKQRNLCWKDHAGFAADQDRCCAGSGWRGVPSIVILIPS